MVKEVQVAAFEGGNLHVQSSGDGGKEVVLALPLNRLLVKMLKVPAEADPVEFATPVLQGMSPYPDEQLTVSCELVRETAEGRVMIAAALPEGASDDLAEALDAAKLSVVRIDALVLGELRMLWNQIDVSGDQRKIVLVKSDDCLSLVALDADQPCAFRAISNGAELKREVMLSLLEAEDFGGPRKIAEIVWVGDGADESLAAFAPVRTIALRNVDAALAGIAERSHEAGSLDVLPVSWREVLEETRFKSKLIRRLAVAAGVWALVMGVLFAVPAAYGYMTGLQKDRCRQHAKKYKAVSDMKAKVELMRKYSDHSHGALEILRRVNEKLPAEGMDFSNWSFRRDEGVTIDGEADDTSSIFELKEGLAAIADEGSGEGEFLFEVVELGQLNSRAGRQKFKLECLHKVAEE